MGHFLQLSVEINQKSPDIEVLQEIYSQMK